MTALRSFAGGTWIDPAPPGLGAATVIRLMASRL